MMTTNDEQPSAKTPSAADKSETPVREPKGTTTEATQGWMDEWRSLSGKWRGLISVATGLTVLVGLYEALTRIVFPHTPSNTKITMATATHAVILVHVSNKGGKASTLQGYRLNFETQPVETRLPIEDRKLSLVDSDGSKTVIPAGGDVTIQLTCLGLRARVRECGETERFTVEEIESLMKGKKVRLEIDVRESNDVGSEHHTPFDEVPADRLHDFIMHWLPQYAAQRG